MEIRNYMFQQPRFGVLVLVCSFFGFYLLYAFQVGVFETTPTPPVFHHELETSELSRSSRYENATVFPFMKAMRSANNKSDPCGGKYIYVHNLASRFNDDMVTECERINKLYDMCKFVTNGGFGPIMNNTTQGVFSDNECWYDTEQFSVSLIFHNRMKHYECLTSDSSIAAAIFVPFYAGFDASRYSLGYNISTRDAASLDLVNWLKNRDEWKIMNGKDHFLVGGRPTWDHRRSTDKETDRGNKFLLLPAVKNMSTLFVESNPWSSNEFAIPYPTYFHPSKDSHVFDWQDRVMKKERIWLFCFAGAPRPNDPASIRSLLIDQCKNSSFCNLLRCGVEDIKCRTPSNVLEMFQSSVFCLQPPGDSYTRRSAFDSILAGCIPVFFHPDSFYTQYTWFVPKNNFRYSVFVPEDDIRKNVSIEQRLRKIDAEKIKMMRDEVINLIPKLMYANPSSKLETLKDAFDISVQAVIDKVTHMRQGMIDGLMNEP
uniref:xyloglucan galactosyltransferase MUR3-like n=1 Tax=Erigeron canadensis TaxID=72917 RepID=UPI001CB919F3|nr:xyloglucan galactosyltransferase MUR3-like [Erigeron canadensis]